jgi:hypothetical protein
MIFPCGVLCSCCVSRKSMFLVLSLLLVLPVTLSLPDVRITLYLSYVFPCCVCSLVSQYRVVDDKHCFAPISLHNTHHVQGRRVLQRGGGSPLWPLSWRDGGWRAAVRSGGRPVCGEPLLPGRQLPQPLGGPHSGIHLRLLSRLHGTAGRGGWFPQRCRTCN